MKEIKAIIQPHVLPRVMEALHSLPHFPGVTVNDCQGQGRGRGSGGSLSDLNHPRGPIRLSLDEPLIWLSAVIASLVLLALLGVGCGGKPTVVTAEGGTAGAGQEYARGPHGGRLLSDDGLQAEISIYERGVPPEFRVYLFDKGKPVSPQGATLQVELRRLGGRVDSIGFKREGEYLVGDKVVDEPHSFDVNVEFEQRGIRHNWTYSQTEGRVELSEEAVRTSAIQVETAGPVKMRTVVDLPGEIALNGDKVTHIVPRTAGIIREIRKNQGDPVRKGEVIAVIDSRELAEVKRHFIDTAQQLDFARKAFEREERLWKRNISSEASYLAEERAHREAELRHRSARQQLVALGIGSAALQALLDDPESDLTRYEVLTPFDGIVIEKNVATGQAVTEDEDLFQVADLATVWVNITVYGKDLNAVRVGQGVTVRSDAVDTEARGAIVYVGSLVGGEARSATARVVLSDPGRQWRPGLFVAARVVQAEETVPVAVKREGLQRFRDWDVVFVRVGDLFEARPLELGRRDGEWVEVLTGLTAGEKYAAANSFILKADIGKAGASHDH